MLERVARRITAFVLIAALAPAPGLAWPAPLSHGPGIDAATAAAARAFVQALNNLHQDGVSMARPQIYLVFNVDVAVLPAGAPALINAGWFDEFMKELASTPAPAESILDQIDADNKHVLSMPSATGLAAMPDSLPFESNPNESVPVERSMSVAMTDALQAAGFDTTNGGTTFKRGTGTVTYEGQNSDGDIIVTGTLVDGRIELTKEFKPLTGGGDVGDPVRIRGTSAPAPTGTPAPANTQTSAAPTTVSNTPSATPLVASPTAYNQTLINNLEDKVQVITPNQTSSVLMGQVLTRDTYVAQLNNTATNLETLLKDPARLDTVVRDLRSDAEMVDNAYQNMLGAERAVAEVQSRNPRVDQEAEYNRSMRTAQQLDAKGDAAGAEKIRQAARNTAYGNFVERQRQFYQALDQNPLLGLGERSSVTPDDFLFKKLRNTLAYNAPNSDYVTLTRPYLERAAAEARDEITRVNGLTTADQFTEFGGPKYERTRNSVGAEGDANGSNLPRQLAESAEGEYEAVQGSNAVRTEITNFGLNLIAGGAWVIPGIGPFIATGAAAIQVIRDGNDLVIAVLDAEDARNLASVTGYTHVITAEDRVAAERGEFVMSVAGLALEGLDAIKVVKGPLPSGTGNAAADVTTGVTATARTTAPPTGAAPTAPPTGAKPTSTPAPSAFNEAPVIPEVVNADGKVTGAKVNRISDAEIAAANAEELAELKEIYDENLARARAAGVSEDRIKQIIGDGEVTDEVANKLYREVTAAEGKISIPRSEYETLTGIDVRNQTGNLTEADYQFLKDKLAQDPNYIDRLPDRGRIPQGSDLGDGFTPGLTAAQRDALLDNPRVAQMVDDAKSAAGAAADGTGTVILPPGSTTGAPPPVTGVPDNTGTVIVSPGSQPGIAGVADDTGTVIVRPGAKPSPGNSTVRDPNGTTLDPNQTTIVPSQTVIIDPDKTSLMPPPTPTTRVDPNTAPTVRLGPEATAPTVRLGPEATAPTVRLGPEATAPTVRLGPEATAPTVRLGPEATAPTVRLDPNATVRMSNELAESLPKAQQAGRSPKDVVKDVRTAMTKLGVAPKQLIATLAPKMLSRVAKPVSMADLGNTSAPAVAPGLAVSLEALGVSSGEAFRMTAVNNAAAPVQLHGEGIVVEPVMGVPARQATSVTSAGGGRGLEKQATSVDVAAPVVTQTVEAFCLERVRPVAPKGTQYRVAPPAVQTQHRKLVDILHAAQRISSVGLLRPDSEVKSYFNFVRQWSIWTRQENFDEKRFTEEFLNQTKKNVESQNVKWTDAMQTTVRKAAPGRWRDITAVLDEANKPKIQAAAGAPIGPHRFVNADVVAVADAPATLAVLVRRHRLGDWS